MSVQIIAAYPGFEVVTVFESGGVINEPVIGWAVPIQPTLRDHLEPITPKGIASTLPNECRSQERRSGVKYPDERVEFGYIWYADEQTFIREMRRDLLGLS